MGVIINFFKAHLFDIICSCILITIMSLCSYHLYRYVVNNEYDKYIIHHEYIHINDNIRIICVNGVLYLRSYYGSLTPVYNTGNELTVKLCDDPNCIFKEKWPLKNN